MRCVSNKSVSSFFVVVFLMTKRPCKITALFCNDRVKNHCDEFFRDCGGRILGPSLRDTFRQFCESDLECRFMVVSS